MDEKLDVQETPVEEPMKNESGGKDYASFGSRLVAALIDFVLLAIVAGFITGGNSVGDGSVTVGASGSIPWLINAVYVVFMLTKYGATLGKMAMKIRVENMETGANPTVVEVILRELVGKVVSTLVILLGYFWMLWDPNKQTWHDKIAKSVVVKSKAV